MILSDGGIRKYIKERQITLWPEPTEDQFQPASLDIHLDRFFRRPRGDIRVIDPAIEQNWMDPVEMVNDEPFLLGPHCLALGSTLETVSLGGLVAAQVDGRSSVGRMGMLVHVTAGWIDPGFFGTVTLELVNLAHVPVKLYPGMRIGQLVFSLLNMPAEVRYGDPARKSSYQGQGRGPVPSAISRNWNPRSTYLKENFDD
jgi:dCTP deaminase